MCTPYLHEFPDPLFRIRLGLGLELKHHVRELQNKRAWSAMVVQPNAPAHDSCRCVSECKVIGIGEALTQVEAVT